MPRRNRVDPWGDLAAVPDRGLLTGNRGCLVDDHELVVRHHVGARWISCTLRYRDHRSPLAAPRRWTPLFFLDEAVALAAGHRPCARCRPEAYRQYRDAVGAGVAAPLPLRAGDLDARLDAERFSGTPPAGIRPGGRRTGRGLVRAADRAVWSQPYADLPDGTVVLLAGTGPHLVRGRNLRPFTFAGWGRPVRRPDTGTASVLTPPTSYAALGNGYRPLLADPLPD